MTSSDFINRWESPGCESCWQTLFLAREAITIKMLLSNRVVTLTRMDL